MTSEIRSQLSSILEEATRAIVKSALIIVAQLIASSAGAAAPPLPFTDIPPTGTIYKEAAETIYRHGVTTGCAYPPLQYCPSNDVTRLQMAVFMLRAIHGPGYQPPAAVHSFSADNPALSTDDAKWASKAIVDGVLGFCATNKFCPGDVLPRYEMARALVRARYGPGDTYPPGPAIPFTDIGSPSLQIYGPYIKRIYGDTVTFGCTATTYCPNDPVTRASMALFMTRNFEWRLPEPTTCSGSPCSRVIPTPTLALSGNSITNSELQGWSVLYRHLPAATVSVSSWNVAAETGLSASVANTKSHQDTFLYNAYQAQGDAFGSHVHSPSFPHNFGISGGGHNVSLNLTLGQLEPVFTQPNSSFVIEAYIKVPVANVSEIGSIYPRGELSLQFQLQQVGTQKVIDYIAKAFDTRQYASGPSNSFQEVNGAEGIVYVPMRGGTTFGHTWVDVTATPAGSTMSNGTTSTGATYSTERFIRFVIKRSELLNAIAALNAQGGTFSTNEQDYRLHRLSIFQEVFHCPFGEDPNVCHNRAVRMGVSGRALKVMEWW